MNKTLIICLPSQRIIEKGEVTARPEAIITGCWTKNPQGSTTCIADMYSKVQTIVEGLSLKSVPSTGKLQKWPIVRHA